MEQGIFSIWILPIYICIFLSNMCTHFPIYTPEMNEWHVCFLVYRAIQIIHFVWIFHVYFCVCKSFYSTIFWHKIVKYWQRVFLARAKYINTHSADVSILFFCSMPNYFEIIFICIHKILSFLLCRFIIIVHYWRGCGGWVVVVGWQRTTTTGALQSNKTYILSQSPARSPSSSRWCKRTYK